VADRILETLRMSREVGGSELTTVLRNLAAGVGVIAAGLVVSIVAYRIMLGIGRMPQERRWFQ
jgi:tight adherence protein B